MSDIKTITKQELSAIGEKVLRVDAKKRRRDKQAHLIATFGHIGFCLGLAQFGAYMFYMMSINIASATVKFSQWYVFISDTINHLLPEFVTNSPLLFLLIAVLAVVFSFAFALVGAIVSLFVPTKHYTYTGKPELSLEEEAEKLRSSIHYHQRYCKISWSDHYPESYHTINMYNFIPWLSYLAGIGLGILATAQLNDAVTKALPVVLVLGIFLTIPIVLLWKLSAIINSVFYRGSTRSLLYYELQQLNKFLTPYDEEKKRKKAEAEAKKSAEKAKKRTQAAEKRDRAYDAESNGLYSLSKRLYKEAAEMGDPLAMDNYARHCLINGDRSEAIRWLQKCIDTGEAGAECKDLLHALKNGEHIDASYCG